MDGADSSIHCSLSELISNPFSLNLYTYRSFGLATDIAGTYVSPDKYFTADLIAKISADRLLNILPALTNLCLLIWRLVLPIL